MKKPNDSYMIRCPRLGHQIYFSYCEKESGDRPCFKTIDCWSPHFDVVFYLKASLDEKDFKRLATGRPKPKMLSLVELIEAAKKKKKDPA